MKKMRVLVKYAQQHPAAPSSAQQRLAAHSGAKRCQAELKKGPEDYKEGLVLILCECVITQHREIIINNSSTIKGVAEKILGRVRDQGKPSILS